MGTIDAGHVIEGLLSIALGLLYLLKHNELKKLRADGNGAVHQTFADDPETFWRRMKEVVMEPLANVLHKQIGLNERILEFLVRGDERRIARGKTAGDQDVDFWMTQFDELKSTVGEIKSKVDDLKSRRR